MTLAEIRDWLKTFGLFDYYFIGTIDGSKENVLGVYTRTATPTPPHALGQRSSYVINGVKVLIHGNQNENKTQLLANQLFENLQDITGVEVGDNLIYYVRLRSNEPISVGMDAHRIFEFVIDFDIYSRR